MLREVYDGPTALGPEGMMAEIISFERARAERLVGSAEGYTLDDLTLVFVETLLAKPKLDHNDRVLLELCSEYDAGMVNFGVALHEYLCGIAAEFEAEAELSSEMNTKQLQVMQWLPTGQAAPLAAALRRLAARLEAEM